MSIAIQKRSRGVSVKRPSRSSGGRERDRVHEDVELAVERLADLAEDSREVVVRADVALGHERRIDRPC